MNIRGGAVYFKLEKCKKYVVPDENLNERHIVLDRNNAGKASDL